MDDVSMRPNATLKLFWALAGALALWACQPESQTGVDKGGAYRNPGVLTEAKLREALSDRTNMSYDPTHGTQVEYTSADGRAYLWYPGNRVILPGFWKIEPLPTLGGITVCFRYGPNTYNPATGHQGDSWECSRWAVGWMNRIVEFQDGDPLRLSSRGAPPFQLPRGRTTLEDLRQRVVRAGG